MCGMLCRQRCTDTVGVGGEPEGWSAKFNEHKYNSRGSCQTNMLIRWVG